MAGASMMMACRAARFSAYSGSHSGGAVGDFLLRGGQFECKGISGWFAALLAVSLRQKFVHRHRGRALMRFVVRCNPGPPLPNTIDERDQFLDFFHRRVTIFDTARGDLIGMERDVVSAFFPRQRVGGAVIDRAAQSRIEVGQGIGDVGCEPGDRRVPFCPRIAGWGENFEVVAFDEHGAPPYVESILPANHSSNQVRLALRASAWMNCSVPKKARCRSNGAFRIGDEVICVAWQRMAAIFCSHTVEISTAWVMLSSGTARICAIP